MRQAIYLKILKVTLVVCGKALQSCPRLFVTLWTIGCQAPLSMGILQARILECVAMPPPRELLNPGIKHSSVSCLCQVGSLPLAPLGKPPFQAEQIAVAKALREGCSRWVQIRAKAACLRHSEHVGD